MFYIVHRWFWILKFLGYWALVIGYFSINNEYGILIKMDAYE